MKRIIRGKEARKKLLEGVRLMYDMVATTLGPKGRNIAIQRQWGAPIVVHDGVTVAREVENEDEFIQMGISLIQEAASKTNTEAGDGTTTSTLLAYEIVRAGIKLIDEGKNPMVLRREIYEALEKLKLELPKLSHKTDKKEDLRKVAIISSGSEEIGNLVAEAVHKVGREGIVTADEGGGEMELFYTQGMEFDKGYKALHFITNPDKMQAVVKDASLILTRKKITMQGEIVPLIDHIAKQGIKDIVVIGDISGDALSFFAVNKMRGNINALVVDTPYYGDRSTNVLDDIAILTGATVIAEEMDITNKEVIEDIAENFLGHAKQVVSSKDKTAVIEGGGDKKLIEERIKEIRTQLKDEDNVYESEKLEERLAKLTTGVGVIKVGAKTDIEMREKVERVKDAIGSARAALDEGVVVGGGRTFINIANVLNSEETDGEKMMFPVLYEPMRKILTNAGEDKDKHEPIMKKCFKNGQNFGYEMNSGKVVDLMKEGIIDPAKVVRLSLENAVGVATSILTTEGLIALK